MSGPLLRPIGIGTLDGTLPKETYKADGAIGAYKPGF
jgi:hypothetical protein